MLAGTQKPMLGTKLNRAHPLAKGLVGCWLFNEGVGNVAYDTSGYGNHGTLTNMLFPPTAASGWNPSKDGGCLNFDGSNDHINCGNDPSLNITDAITIEAWVKPGTRPGGYGTIVCRNIISDSYWFAIHNNGKILFYLEDVKNYITATGKFSLNEWSHIIVTYDKDSGSDNLNFYVNGNSVESSTETGSIGETTGRFLIGIDYPIAPAYEFNGIIDGVKIYNRALNAEEIKWLYRAPYCMFEEGELLL